MATRPDTYITYTEAYDYLSLGLRMNYDPWFEAEEETRYQALEEATRILLRLPWSGLPATATQRLWHPVAGDSAIPVQIKEACALIAVELLRGRDPEKEYLSVTLSSERFTRVGATRDTNLIPPHFAAAIPSLEAWRLIRPFLAELREVNMVRVD